MENETELIRQQMLETRTSLSEKLEALQEQVLGTVEETTQSVTETVQAVEETVEETVSAVSHSVEDTVEAITNAFDLSSQVEKHPWLMVGGAVMVGYIGGRLAERVADTPPPPSLPAYARPVTNGHAPAAGPGWLTSLLGPVAKQLQGLAMGALAGTAEEFIRNKAPEPLRKQLREVASTLSTSLGGPPLEERPDGPTVGGTI